METSKADILVVVTGATGFIAQHCIRQLLDAGYKVRGSLRDVSKAEALMDVLPQSAEQRSRLSLMPADLLDEAGWEELMQGATYVLHTASPVPMAPPKDENVLIAPAREGTLRVLKAAASEGVKKVVVTSSIAAVLSSGERTQGRCYTEEDFSDPEGDIGAYAKSKTLAERAAWDFQKSLSADERFELCTINPSFVLGPSVDGHENASNEIVRKLLDREVPGLPRLYFPIVDVRDVAQAHLLAMTHPGCDGERFIVNTSDLWYADIAATLANNGYRVPTRSLPDWLLKIVSWFDRTVALVVDDVGWEFHPSSEKARKILGWTTRDSSDTVLDTARNISALRTTS